ncbi:MAE_28990/MAE_18760 family HEPN-like nuclease [Clostridium sp. OS1-26]|uniref:MAE_28990/MAE_18760 family HEPN-like nuclease n=1 Tax=Clostridium sp. OS1-26 TaxID=3070681 RepID=UPI0027DF92E4|nr:MAE_28990/MAE_18760 family HEPN-like nuclease [Clostridium sp. OS1-26]WML36198.1 MAE_28990/MAE_18760 family HEPN-like nuclease [Clostridium sp. OS1-26]
MSSNDELIEAFINDMDTELSIRKKELYLIKEILDSITNIPNKFTIIRNTVPSLYAHYEGFLKFSFQKLIETIKSMDIDNSDINKKFLIMCLVTNLEDHISSQKSKSKVLISNFDKIYKNNDNILNVTKLDKYILNHDTLDQTCEILGIDLDKILIDKQNFREFPKAELGILYARRNEIAHGDISTSNQFSISKQKDITNGQVSFAYKNWVENYNCVLGALDLIKNMFIDYLMNEHYLDKVI